jgi:hypothetical protein
MAQDQDWIKARRSCRGFCNGVPVGLLERFLGRAKLPEYCTEAHGRYCHDDC